MPARCVSHIFSIRLELTDSESIFMADKYCVPFGQMSGGVNANTMYDCNYILIAVAILVLCISQVKLNLLLQLFFTITAAVILL